MKITFTCEFVLIMIGKIAGLFSGYYGNTALIEIQYMDGCIIGYEVMMKTADLQNIAVGSNVVVFIKEIVKEDDDVLYGFLSFEERVWFEEFIKLTGLGAKIALSILSTYSCEAITDAILTNNCDFFSSISGIGSKLANRIPMEMSKQISKIHEKVLTFGGNQNAVQSKHAEVNKSNDLYKKSCDLAEKNGKNEVKKSGKSVDKNKNQSDRQKVNDAIDALVSLGFARNKVYDVVFKIVKDTGNITTEEIVVEFLKSNS